MKARYLAAAVLVAMFAVAASTANGSTSRSHASKIVVWLQNDAQNGWPEAVALANRNFKAQHPDVDVDVQYQSWGTHLTKFDAGLAGGDAPDVIELGNTEMTKYMAAGAFKTLSQSAFQLGLVAFFSQAPTSVIAPLAGALVDRWGRHRTLLVTQAVALLQSAALAAFALTGTMTVGHLMVLGAVQAVINAFDMPARQALQRQIVEDRADLPNALALNASLDVAADTISVLSSPIASH